MKNVEKLVKKLNKALGIKGEKDTEDSYIWTHCGFTIILKTEDFHDYYMLYLIYNEPTAITLLFQSKHPKRVTNVVKIIYEQHVKINPQGIEKYEKQARDQYHRSYS